MVIVSPTERLLYIASSSEITQTSSLVPSSNIEPSTIDALPFINAVIELSLLYPIMEKSPEENAPPIIPPIPLGLLGLLLSSPSRLPSSVPSLSSELSAVSSLTGLKLSEPLK